jgi:spore coat polysaccharide biosynthesis predicted glycosyltransferase SpsG/2-polyprenyl-3-methyl-5-hydroxy-6-metoxy-1,4-benzoquinol methylase
MTESGHNARVAIFCDCLPSTGIGHAVRCLALGRELAARGALVRHVLAEGSATEPHRIAGVVPDLLAAAPDSPELAGILDDFLRRTEADLLVADSYLARPAFYADLAAARPTLPVLAFDDQGEKAGLPLLGVLATGLAAEPDPFPGRFAPFSAVGPEFFPLSETSRRTFERAPRHDGRLERLLLVMGGSDPEGQTVRLARLLRTLDNLPEVHVVAGPLFGDTAKLRRTLADDPRFRLHESPPDLHALAASCDLAFTGAGITLVELLSLGVPVAALILADNQEPAARALGKREMGLVLGRFDRLDDEELLAAVRRAMADPERLERSAAKGRALIDGRGAGRLADKVLEILARYRGETFAADEVVEEYRRASAHPEPYRKALWGSAEGMTNRFLLALEALGPGPLGSWCDVGCGTGDFLLTAESAREVESCTGLDLSPEMIAFASGRDFRTRDRRFLRQSFLEPVPGAPFDLVTCLGVLQKCGLGLKRAVRGLARLVRPGGRVLASTKNLGWKAFDAPGFLPYPGHHWFRPAQIQEAFEEAGLRLEFLRGMDTRTKTFQAPEDSHNLLVLGVREGGHA